MPGSEGKQVCGSPYDSRSYISSEMTMRSRRAARSAIPASPSRVIWAPVGLDGEPGGIALGRSARGAGRGGGPGQPLAGHLGPGGVGRVAEEDRLGALRQVGLQVAGADAEVGLHAG